MQKDSSPEGKELHLDWGKQDKDVTNCSRHILLSNWDHRSDAFSAGATIKPPPGPLESRNIRLHTKDRAFKCLPPLMSTSEVLQSIPPVFIMWVPCSTIDPLGLSMSKHKSTPMLCTACSTPGMICSLLSIISSLAAGIKPLLVSSSTTQNSGKNNPINNLTSSSVECI